MEPEARDESDEEDDRAQCVEEEARVARHTRLPQNEENRRIDRIPPEARPIDREAAGERRVNGEPNDNGSRSCRVGERRGGYRYPEQLPVRARLVEVAVVRLRVPAQDAARIRGIVGELP